MFLDRAPCVGTPTGTPNHHVLQGCGYYARGRGKEGTAH